MAEQAHHNEYKRLFLLSFDDRDALTDALIKGGWRVMSARRRDNIISRVLAAKALVLIVDLRHDPAAGLSVISELSPFAEKNGLALMALGYGGNDSGLAKKSLDHGATHFVPTEEGEQLKLLSKRLLCQMDFALRFVERLHGGEGALHQLSSIFTGTDWDWSLVLTQPIELNYNDKIQGRFSDKDLKLYPKTALYRHISKHHRVLAREAFAKIRAGLNHTVFAHEIFGRSVIHHLTMAEGASGVRINGRIEQARIQDEGESWAAHDLLSGLRNATSAKKWLQQMETEQEGLAVILVGLNNFSAVNIAYGREAGDTILRLVGQRLMRTCEHLHKDSSIVARMDSQNFMIGLKIGAVEDTPQALAQNIYEAISRPIGFGEGHIHLGAKIGLSQGDAAQSSLMLKQANLALINAFTSDQFLVESPAQDDGFAQVSDRLEGDILQAISENEILIALQPQFRIDTGQLTGVEALARWRHPEFGVIGAGPLFAAAERAGLMTAISDHIHKRSIEIAAAWPDSLSFLRLSINAVAADLAHPDFLGNLFSILKDTGFSRDKLTVEITESGLISNLESATKTLTELRSNNIKIAIDDFGTGYSSLSYLKALPLDYLKIDSGLTGDISGSAKDQIVVKSVIEMAHSLHLDVIAEGVETRNQLAILNDLNCTYFQGFLRSGPLFPDEFEAFALLND